MTPGLQGRPGWGSSSNSKGPQKGKTPHEPRGLAEPLAQRQEEAVLMDWTEALRPAAFCPLRPPGRCAPQPSCRSQVLRAGRNTIPAEIKLGSSGFPGLRVQMKLRRRKTKLLFGRLPWWPETCTWAVQPGAWLPAGTCPAPGPAPPERNMSLHTNTKHNSGDQPEVPKFYPKQREEPGPAYDGKSLELLSAGEPWLSLSGRASVSRLSPDPPRRPG